MLGEEQKSKQHSPNDLQLQYGDIGDATTVQIHLLDPFKRECLPSGHQLVESSLQIPLRPFVHSHFPLETADLEGLSWQEQRLGKFVERVWQVVSERSIECPHAEPSAYEKMRQTAKQIDQLLQMLTHFAGSEPAACDMVEVTSEMDATSLVNNVCYTRNEQELTLPNGLTVVLPKHSAFCWANLKSFRLSELVGSVGKQQLLVVDPPWGNRSVRRAKKYDVMTTGELLRLEVGSLADPTGCMLALWVTNDPAVVSFAVQELMPKWGFEFVEEWLWLKVAANGELVSSVTSRHKKPYERLLLGRYKVHGTAMDERLPTPAAKRRKMLHEDQISAVASASNHSDSKATYNPYTPLSIPASVYICPSLRHSMKPPIERYLVDWCKRMLPATKVTEAGIGCRQLKATEIFAREMKEGFTSIGNQPLLFQAKDIFLTSANTDLHQQQHELA